MFKKTFFLVLLFGISGMCLLPSTVKAETPATARAFFPPSNVGTGGGFLFFPDGGNGSLYAAPVFADERVVTALQDIKESMETFNGTIQELKTSIENSNNASNIDCSASELTVVCVNKLSGQLCIRYASANTTIGGNWQCVSGAGWGL